MNPTQALFKEKKIQNIINNLQTKPIIAILI